MPKITRNSWTILNASGLNCRENQAVKGGARPHDRISWILVKW
jgi:hypothetical protein